MKQHYLAFVAFALVIFGCDRAEEPHDTGSYNSISIGTIGEEFTLCPTQEYRVYFQIYGGGSADSLYLDFDDGTDTVLTDIYVGRQFSHAFTASGYFRIDYTYYKRQQPFQGSYGVYINHESFTTEITVDAASPEDREYSLLPSTYYQGYPIYLASKGPQGQLAAWEIIDPQGDTTFHEGDSIAPTFQLTGMHQATVTYACDSGVSSFASAEFDILPVTQVPFPVTAVRFFGVYDLPHQGRPLVYFELWQNDSIRLQRTVERSLGGDGWTEFFPPTDLQSGEYLIDVPSIDTQFTVKVFVDGQLEFEESTTVYKMLVRGYPNIEVDRLGFEFFVEFLWE